MAEEFEGNFECLRENTEKYFTKSVPIKKEHDNDKTTIYKLKFIDSYRFMQDLLSNLVDNLTEINNKKPKNKFIDNMRSMVFSLLQSIDKISDIDRKVSHAALIENFPNTYQLSNKDLNKFPLLLRKGVYPYEYMDSWNKFNESVLLVEDH